MIASPIYGLYIGCWVMFIKPIIDAVNAFSSDMLTTKMLVVTVLKCMFAGFVGTIVFYVGYIIGRVILYFVNE